jgi:Ca2+-binding EF-hand superfamily protein
MYECAVLHRYDNDANGVMDRQEFKAFMEELFGRRVTAKEVETMFREINVHQDQTIDTGEFKGFCFGSGRFGEAGRYMKDVLSESRPKGPD